ncbi:MAG: helix-turn-helix domain-containing protein [Dehalococcoidia bacterium]|jgi:DNA-binding transcriptional MerR regulator|nr:helix-turn-helix domain-containing protein [Dehalococcoidia bacterium]
MTSSHNPANPVNPGGRDSSLSVGELSRRTGVTTATINYYVRIGVLPPPRKTSRTRALYPAHFEGLIRKIRELQAAGLNLKGIAQVVNGDPDSPLAAVMPSPETTGPDASQSTQPVSGPIPVAEFIEQSGLDDDLYGNLIVVGLIRRPRTGPDGAPAHDRRDLSAARAFARLSSAGVEYPLLERHREYEPLSKAEALFLAEHLGSVSRESPANQPASLVSAFDTIRRYLRSLQLDEAYPEWRNPRA